MSIAYHNNWDMVVVELTGVYLISKNNKLVQMVLRSKLDKLMVTTSLDTYRTYVI